jgi:hypothetical protein
MAWSFAGLAFILATLIASIIEKKMSALAFIFSIAFFLIIETTRTWEIEDWKIISEQVNKLDLNQDTQLLLYSGLAESRNLTWLQENEKSAYLQSPFNYYPVKYRINSLPPQINSENAQKYFDSLLEKSFNNNTHAIFVCLNNKLIGTDSKLSPISTCEHYDQLFNQNFLKLDKILSNGLVKAVVYSRKDAVDAMP